MKRERILLADDHSLILTGVRALLADQFDLVEEVTDGRSLVTTALRLKPDLVILDVAMPLLNGIEAARQIKKAWPQAKLLFLTMHADSTYLREALQVADGYVLKSSASEELPDAVRCVLNGQRYLSKSIDWGSTGAVPPHADASQGAANLTNRQREVLQLLAEGRSNKEMATILGVSTKTVEFHRAQMMRTLGVHTVAELTIQAIRLGLIKGGGPTL